MKRFLLILLLSVYHCITHAYDVKVGSIYYNIDKENKTATVTYKQLVSDKKGRIDYQGKYHIPEKIKVKKDHYTVSSIGDSAFFGCMEIEFISLPNTIKTIGKSAFEGCAYYLKEEENTYYTTDEGKILHNSISYRMPQSLISIGDRAFAYSTVYENLYLPDSLTYIGNEAFLGSTITTVYMNEAIQHIGYAAFEDCTHLVGVSINNMEAWCRIDFETLYSNPLASAHNLIMSNNKLLTDIVIPGSITKILPNAFAGSNALTITIPSSVKSIGNYAFYGCKKLNKVYIGNPSINIDDNNFEEYELDQLISSNLCQPPVITFKDGNLRIESSTPNAVCQYLIRPEEVDTDGVIKELIIYAVAKAEGYEESEMIKVDLLKELEKENNKE